MNIGCCELVGRFKKQGLVLCSDSCNDRWAIIYIAYMRQLKVPLAGVRQLMADRILRWASMCILFWQPAPARHVQESATAAAAVQASATAASATRRPAFGTAARPALHSRPPTVYRLCAAR